jgi:guanyl-specific ribonuclease Sa
MARRVGNNRRPRPITMARQHNQARSSAAYSLSNATVNATAPAKERKRERPEAIPVVDLPSVSQTEVDLILARKYRCA